MVIKGKAVYHFPMDASSLAPPLTLPGEDLADSLEADVGRVEAMVPQMAAAAQAAQVDARARIAALHARIAQDVAALRKSEARVPSSR